MVRDKVTPKTAEVEVPCLHIADYYQSRWEEHHCIAYNVLRHGYRQCAEGRHYNKPDNNLYDVTQA